MNSSVGINKMYGNSLRATHNGQRTSRWRQREKAAGRRWLWARYVDFFVRAQWALPQLQADWLKPQCL